MATYKVWLPTQFIALHLCDSCRMPTGSSLCRALVTEDYPGNCMLKSVCVIIFIVHLWIANTECK